MSNDDPEYMVSHEDRTSLCGEPKPLWKRALMFIYREVVPAVVLIAVIILGMAWYIDYYKRNPGMEESPWMYRDFRAVIVGMGTQSSVTDDKFQTPIGLKSVVFRIDGSSYPCPIPNADYGFVLREYQGNAHDGMSSFANALLTDEWYSNHRIGDTVTFKYINRKRVFTLLRR